MQTSKIAEINLTYHPKKAATPTVICSTDAYKIFQDYFPKETISLQERVIAMYLNRSNKVIGIITVSIGGLTGTVADIRLILSIALKAAATGIMLAHNHPSGSLRPSRADEDLTLKLKDAGRVMDITLLDHLILSPDKGTIIVLLMKGYYEQFINAISNRP